MDTEDKFTCNIDGETTLEVCDNADGENILVSITGMGVHDIDSLSIALNADQANALAESLYVYAAGL